MSVVLLFEARLWEHSPARHAIETIASLQAFRWRSTVSRDDVGEGEAIVFVGAAESAPPSADLAALVRVHDWPFWAPESLALADFEGVPLPAPAGRLTPASLPAELPPEWLRAAGFLLAREEELIDGRRDQWECYSGAYTRMAALGVLDRPLVNLMAHGLETRIESWCRRRGATFERVPRWKGGARFAAALTHDVDDVRLHSTAQAWRLLRQARGPGSYAARAGVMKLLRSMTRPGATDDPYWRFDRWAAEEERRGFRSSYYFCPPAPTRRHAYDALYAVDDPVRFDGARTDVAGLMRALAGRGHEIGLHGSYHSHRDGAELTRQREQIERAAGAPVTGTRQHFLRFDIRATWEAQREAGFAYDTTLGYNEGIGFRAGIAAPFHPFDHRRGRGHDLLELPLTLMDGTLFRTLSLDAAGASARVRAHLEAVEEAGGLAVLLWHPNAADERSFPGWWAAYLAALDHLAARGAWVAPAAEIATWWRTRGRSAHAPA